jgi:hypothetical protein
MVIKERSPKLLAVGKPLLKKREKWRTPSYFRSMLKTNRVILQTLMWPTRHRSKRKISRRKSSEQHADFHASEWWRSNLRVRSSVNRRRGI